MQRTRESAIASAVEKAKGEINTSSSVSPNTQEMTKKHAHEIQVLRAEHEAALKTAVEAAVAAAKAETTNAPSDDATKATISAAIADHDHKMQAKHAEEISAAVERGRMEQGAKSKLKDAQLVRAQNKLKELEAQVLEWRKAGLVPSATAAATPAPAGAPTVTIPASSAAPPATPTTPVASTSKMPAPAAPAASEPAASTSAPAATPAAPVPSAGPVRRALGGAVSLGTTDAVGRGRGMPPRPRGRGFNIRGAAPSHSHGRGAGAGAGPSPTAEVAASSATVGVQIMGAANKRGREDETQPDDSLAKRLKPAGEGVAVAGGAAPTAAGGSKPPVALRRPPPS